MGDELRPPLTQRLRLRHWLALDALLALVITVPILTSHPGTVTGRLGAATWPVPVVLGVTLIGSVALRRVHPVPALLAAVVAETAAGLAGLVAAVGFATAATLYTAALSGRSRRVVWAAGAGAVAAGFVIAPIPLYPAIPAWAFGALLRTRREYAAALRRQAERQGRERAERQAAADAAEERLRIARELHDVVAHSMSLITVQAGVAHFVGAERPEEALRALGSIEATGRTALREMRRLLGILREGSDTPHSAELAPAPTLAAVDTLVSDAAAAGLRVELIVHGERRELPVGVEHAAYRIIQEALTNVVRHADTDHCRVELRYTHGEIEVAIADSGSGGGAAVPGHGLVGMRERVAAYGGEFDAGPLPERGFRVSARVPIEDGAR
ncbi:sensor histidine kinase [Embleya scabrispora]|uniref:sensor histidine kinase n=1 Tax=Embleya scabrispora TaxID=159449 RepID=UPI00035F4FE6|nr:sensor histidine kinase [Embleya scabrispora]MYS86453.1 histidine kinase [Streptomyces sp. SID5474]